MRLSLVYIGTTGAGPVYAFEMAKALAESNKCELQIIISSNVSNIESWDDYFLKLSGVDYNVIDSYNHTTPAVLKTIFFDKKKKQKVVDLINNFNADVLYIPFGFMWDKYVYPRINKNIRIITTIHDPHPHDSFVDGFKWFVFRMLTYSDSWKHVSDIVILNQRDVEYVRNKFNKNVVVIPHASFNYYVKTDKEDYSIRNKIGFFGRIEPYKGLDILVEAFEQTANEKIRLLIAGSGNIEQSLLDKIKKNQNIELNNRYIDDDEFQSLMDKIDFVVLPYKRASQSGVIPMSFAFGKPVVATNVGALEEQVPEGTGLIVAPTANEVKEAIIKLYSNPTLIEEYGRKAKRYAETELTWSHSAKLLLSCILSEK